MGATKFSETIVIRRNQTDVFDFTQDYSKRLVWDTFLSKAEMLNETGEAGLGEKAYCVARNGMGMETEYVSFRRPKVTAIKMTQGPFLFKSFLGSWTFHKRAEQETEVVFLYAFQLRFPFSIGSFLMKRILQKEVKGRLEDLKTFLENKQIMA